MKSANGIIRNVDELGRIVVPKEMRTKLDIKNGDPVDISIDGDKVIIRKYQTGCMFCGNADVLHTFKDKKICGKCLSEIKESL